MLVCNILSWCLIVIFCVRLDADMFSFQGLLFCPEASSLLLHNFCIYHISPIGHEVGNSCLTAMTFHFVKCNSYPLLHRFFQESLQLGAPVIGVDAPLLSADDLADQIVEVLNYFG